VRYLITGGLGFQGTHLSKALLERKHTVFVLNTPSVHAKKNLDWLQQNTNTKELNVLWASITDTETLKRVVPQVDIIFHLAAKVNVDESIVNPDVFFETNIRGTYNILNLACEKKARVIMASTCEVYGGGDQLDEDSPIMPKSPYGASKAAADRIGFAYNKTFGIPIDIVRPFNVYGPLQKEEGRGAVIAIFFKKILMNEELRIHGDGAQSRDFIFINDVIRGYLGILNSPNKDACRIFTFGTGKATSINEIISTIENIVGHSVKKKYVEGRRGQVDNFVAKKSVNDYFGGTEQVSLQDGLSRYYLWRFKQ